MENISRRNMLRGALSSAALCTVSGTALNFCASELSAAFEKAQPTTTTRKVGSALSGALVGFGISRVMRVLNPQ